jgi:hypothetical protein
MKRRTFVFRFGVTTLFLFAFLFINTQKVFAVSENITQINFTTSPQTVEVNTASGVLTTQTQNSEGVDEKVSSSQVINLSSSSETGEFSDSNSTTCTGDWSFTPRILTMRSGSANKNFCYRDSMAGIHTLTITAQDQSWVTATQDITISAPDIISPVLGCTDPDAENYDSGATEDDESCAYPEGGLILPPGDDDEGEEEQGDNDDQNDNDDDQNDEQGSQNQPSTKSSGSRPRIAQSVSEVLGAENFQFTQYMRRGSRDGEVLELQKRLQSMSLYWGKLDGIFGILTEAAVKAYQMANPPLRVDGIVGPRTRAVLNK